MGIIRLAKAAGNPRMEAACRRALHFGTCSYASLKSILQNNLEVEPLEQEPPPPSPIHEQTSLKPAKAGGNTRKFNSSKAGLLRRCCRWVS